MENVVRKLEKIIEDMEAAPRKAHGLVNMPKRSSNTKIKSITNPWAPGSAVATALDTFGARIEDAESRSKLQELRDEVKEALGAEAVDAAEGVYNAARLYRYLRINKMDVQDAKAMTIVNLNAREEFQMDAKRRLIVEQDLRFDTLPRMQEFIQVQPMNPMVGTSICGDHVGYVCWGSGVNFEGLKKSFTVEEYLDIVMYNIELARLRLDADCAIKGRDIAFVLLYDMGV